MTATVVLLDAERRNRRPTAGCQRCEMRTDGSRCFPHRLDDLADRLRAHDPSDALLIPSEELADVLADVLGVLDGITSECLTRTDERTTK